MPFAAALHSRAAPVFGVALLLSCMLKGVMELQFTFAKPAAETPADADEKSLPFSLTPSSSSSEIILTVTESESELLAVAKAGDGVEYARQTRQVSGDPVRDYRSAVARAVAELDKLASAVTKLELPVSGLTALATAGFISADSTTTAAFEQRSGLAPGITVTAVS